MTQEQFKQLHKDLCIKIGKRPEINSLPSDTDPTQDIPIKNIELAANGMPINVKTHNMPMNGVKVENFTSADRRNMDQFDMVNELQQLAKTPSQKGVTTNFINPKKSKQNEK